MTAEPMTLLPAAKRIAERRGMTMPPKTATRWGMRVCHANMMSSREYRWPFPGVWAKPAGPVLESNKGACPRATGDGLCVATSWHGMASGGISAAGVVLLVAWSPRDVVGTDDRVGKVRVRRAFVVDVFTVSELLAELRDGEPLNLTGASLDGASLRGASLDGASLDGASLDGASLDGASLDGASLRGASLDGANLDRTLR